MTTSEATIAFKPRDVIGRVKAFSDRPVSGSAFVDLCQEIEFRATGTASSRWSLRALVERGAAPAKDLLQGLTDAGGPIEVNRLPVAIDGDDSWDYLWVARNLRDRVPSVSTQAAFLEKVERRVAGQEDLFADYTALADRLLTSAEAAGWAIVCNDPIGDWGCGGVDATTFRSLLQHLFWFDRSQADAMLRGEGYSTHGHYVFALNNRSGDTLCIFVLARFAWGFEGTYTMVNPLLPARDLAGAARTLMLLANALTLDRHGPDTLLYGEANARNIPACISAGYAVVPPRGCEPGNRLHENIVWADNPIGEVHDVNDTLAPPQPPHYNEVEYINYALMRARNELVLPLGDRALALLRK